MKFRLLVVAACLLTSCDPQKNRAESPGSDAAELPDPLTVFTPSDEKEPCCSEHPSPDAIEASEDSIYQIESQWQDQKGEKRRLSSLGGKVQVVTMGYSTCQFACPRLLADMRMIEAGLPKEISEKTGFAFFSIDPETDSPSRLAEYGKENHLDPGQWTLLTSEVSSVQELAVVLGIQYRRVDSKDFAHSNLITVLNQKGEVIYRQEGLAADPAETIKAIIKASK